MTTALRFLKSTVAALAVAATSWALTATPAAAQAKELDPASVSEGLKAIFNYRTDNKAIKERLNLNTITVVLGPLGGTYLNIGADLSTILDDEENLRVLPVVGKGSVKSIADILFLRGVDLGIVRADTLDYLERKGYVNNIKRQFTYITKLYNEEVHVVAGRSVKRMQDLDGKRVAIDLPDGGTFITASTIFERLGIKPIYSYMEQRLAQEKLKKGEIDAFVAVQGTPSRSVGQMTGEFHLVPIEYAGPLQADYFPSVLKAEDYPTLLQPGERIDTVSVAAILAGYNWPANTERYRKMEHFVQIFFDKFKNFQQPPFHPKWKEVALGAPLKGWERFKPAQDWLDSHAATASGEVRGKFDQFLASRSMAPGTRAALTPDQSEALFQQFLKWQITQTAPRPAVARPPAAALPQ
ncbi:TAXI family TRAP transporter solute-binding subunit [Tardiphaga sp.]|jgi:TRAP transporter TAXI family solute receptor|uniref:TAXI family TRAP transporter solute-binding subunit n=1 Tax=Tardiphaga sp. TaxID=1926292 RepID=UPI0025EDD9F3|nr:TAXI family TRAP transporter solute-binding subunit [Tardiphaga sp.]